ncbi:MAG TPA: glycosyltransferase family 4 protein [Tepidisphaeraceae bacterium]|jgi:glycosyltransferase involved in cell wall biosynthesis|nr:glycosyltransferase family 4 protein [Tepidisphaeraceae bacterium]
MRILVAHNFYQQAGGEDEVFRAEVALLRRFGHDVCTFELHNDALAEMSKIGMLTTTLWSGSAHRDMRQKVRQTGAEVVHFHNTFPRISPAAYYAARMEGAAVVQTLHNFRLLCPGANLFRDGKACEECIGKRLPMAGITHKCYRQSTSASAGVAALIATHHAMGTWRNAVDLYLAPTEFARKKFLAGGLPVEKLFVKPNFVDPDPGIGLGDGGYAVYVARLSAEKGLETLLAGWEKLGGSVPLKIVGDGPLAHLVAQTQKTTPNIEWLGRRALAEVYDIIGRASMLIFPSRCYETFGRVAVEAYSKGTPVIASNHGAPGDIVREGKTGLLFEPGNGNALADAVRKLMADPALLAAMRRESRIEYERRYTGAANHAQLMTAYGRAIEASRSKARKKSANDAA